MTHVSIANWFYENYTYAESTKLRKKYVPIPKSYLDDDENVERYECDHCGGRGECQECNGDGTLEHICDCEFCDVYEEDCDECSGTGDCYVCKGTGYLED